jgi:hypothetical protein
VLVDPANTTITETTLRDLEPAARAMGLEIQVLNASNGREISAAFAPFVRDRPDALFVSTGAFFTARRDLRARASSRCPQAAGATADCVHGHGCCGHVQVLDSVRAKTVPCEVRVDRQVERGGAQSKFLRVLGRYSILLG